MATILVVDDELGIRALLSEILTDEGHTVEAAEDAAQARQMRERLRPDLVLLDIWMPDVDGITLLKEWGSNGHLTMPVIMMSGHGTIDTAVEAMKYGASAFLEKPITLQKLLRAVEEGLNRQGEGRAGVGAEGSAAAAAGLRLVGAPGAPGMGGHGAGVGAGVPGHGAAGLRFGGAADGSGGMGGGPGAMAHNAAAGAVGSAVFGANAGGATAGYGLATGPLGGADGGGGADRAVELLSPSQQVFELDRPLREARDAFEKAYFEYHLAKENGSMTRVAEKTGLERTHLYRKLKHLGVDLSRTRRSSH